MSSVTDAVGSRRRPLLVLVAVLAVAQAIWLVGDWGARRRQDLENRQGDPAGIVTLQLRHEVESVQRQLGVINTQAESVMKLRLQDRVDEALVIAQAIHDQMIGHAAPAEIRSLIRETLRNQRFFDGRGYYFIDDLDGNCVLLPTQPQLEGLSLLDNRDDAGNYIMRELLRAVKDDNGAGFARYGWYRPGQPGRMDEKVAFVRMFAPFGWLIGTGDYTDQVLDGLKRDAIERLRATRLPLGGRMVVIDATGTVKLFPVQPDLEGKVLAELPDSPEQKALAALWAASRGGGAQASFQLPTSDTGRAGRWVAWVQGEASFNWVVAAMAPAPEIRAGDDGDQDMDLGVFRYGLPAALLVLAAMEAVILGFGGGFRR